MLTWTQQTPFGAYPSPTYDNCAVGLDGKLYVFGGNRSPEGSVPRLSHDMHILDIETGFWTQQRTSPMQPCARAGHNMIVAGSSIYILCGWTWHSDDALYLGDAFVYSTKDDLWTPIHATGTPPIGRAHACAAYFREQIFLFGGCNGTVAANYRRDLMVLNLRTLNWTEMIAATPPPMGRSHAAMCCLSGRLYLFGGQNLQGGKKRVLGDLQAFDVAERTWTLLSDSDVGGGPGPRAWHSLVAGNQGVFLFGGSGGHASPAPFFDALWVYNPLSQAWHNLSRRTAAEDEDPSLLPKRPNARGAFAMATVTCASSACMLFVMGGISTASASKAPSVSSGMGRTGDGGSGSTVIMGDVFKVDLTGWHGNLPAEEIEREFLKADFTGRALATMPRHAGGALTARGVAGEVSGRRSVSSVASSTTASSSAASQALSPVVRRAAGLEAQRKEDERAARAEQERFGTRQHGAAAAAAAADSSCMVWELHAPRGDGPEGEAPPPRSGHASVAIGRRIYVCGGLAEETGRREYLMDMFALDLSRGAWSRVEVPDREDGEEGYMPEGRAGHSMVTVEQAHMHIWVMGGWCVHEGKSFFFNDVHTFDPLRRTWTKVDTVGEAPVPRAYATAAVVRSKIVMFGGCNGTLASHFRNDLWMLDVQLKTWTRINVPATELQPSGRAQHSMVHYGGHLYVFGGNNKRGGKRHLLADLFLFDMAKGKWVLLNDGHGGGECGGQGEAPSKRSGHAMVIQNGGLFVFGGAGSEEGADGFYDSLWVFDTAARTWSLLTQEDEQGLVGSKRPCARAGHSMVAIDNIVFVFGGLCPAGGGQSAAVRPLGDLASFHSTGWRHAMPKFVSDRKREAATRLLAKLQGLDDHGSSRLLDACHAFRGAAREAYNRALDKPYGDSDDEVEVEDPNVIRLSHNVSAQLSVLNQRIDAMIGRVAPQRRDLLQMQRQVQLGPIMAQGGLLEVTVRSGHDLPKMDRFGKSDPYCVVEAEGHKHKTKILKKTLNPVWNESFKLKVVDTGSRVVVTCYDWDFADAHDFMGRVVVKLDDLIDGPLDQFFTLRDEEGQAMQGSLRLLLEYRPADTGVNDTKRAIANALQTLQPEEQEEILGVAVDWDGGQQAEVGGHGTGTQAARREGAQMERTVGKSEALAVGEEVSQVKKRHKMSVERRRLDNLAEIERLRREQLRDEELERKIRQLAKLEQLEEEQIVKRRVEEEDREADVAIKSKVESIAQVAVVRPVDKSIHWHENPAQQLQDSLDAEMQLIHERSSPPRREPQAPAPLKPVPPEVKKRGEGGAGGGRPRPPSTRTGQAGAGGETGGAGEQGAGMYERKSVLTTMFGKGVSVEAKRRMIQELKAKKKGEVEEADAFQKEMRAIEDKMRFEAEKEAIEQRRLEKLNSEAEQRRRVALKLQQEERTKAQIAEKRDRALAELEAAEQAEAEQRRQHHAGLEARRRQRVAEAEERRRNDPELVAKAKRLNEYVATSTMRRLNHIKQSQHSADLSASQEMLEQLSIEAADDVQEHTAAAVMEPGERQEFGDEIAAALASAKRHM